MRKKKCISCDGEGCDKCNDTGEVDMEEKEYV